MFDNFNILSIRGDKNVSKNSGELREEKNFKQIVIANHLKISVVVYSRYEKGTRTIPIEALSILADYYNTTIDYIVELTDKR